MNAMVVMRPTASASAHGPASRLLPSHDTFARMGSEQGVAVALIPLLAMACAQPRPHAPLETAHFGAICPTELLTINRSEPVQTAAASAVPIDPLYPPSRIPREALLADVCAGPNSAGDCASPVSPRLRQRAEELLASFDEPALVHDGCRFVTSPSFGALSMGRIVRFGTEAIVTIKVVERRPAEGQLSWRRLKRVDLAEFRRFEDAVARAGFWQMPAHVAEPPSHDGVQYYFECRRAPQHRLVSRSHGALQSLATQLIALAGCPRANEH
ncbi:MAG: hypothetical protein IPI67_21005 [Myxococcales bacterium]|nr:hypothetical protein [Myxococcales bacterium]